MKIRSLILKSATTRYLNSSFSHFGTNSTLSPCFYKVRIFTSSAGNNRKKAYIPKDLLKPVLPEPCKPKVGFPKAPPVFRKPIPGPRIGKYYIEQDDTILDMTSSKTSIQIKKELRIQAERRMRKENALDAKLQRVYLKTKELSDKFDIIKQETLLIENKIEY